MKLDLSVGEDALRELQMVTAPGEINLLPPKGVEARFEHEITASVSVRRVGEEFFVHGEVATNAVYTCVRCLSEYPTGLKAELEVIVHRVTAPQGQGPGPDLESYVELPLGASEFNLGPHAREALLLALPQTPHCTEACRGLCPHCGVDLNRESCRCPEQTNDPRWDALRTLSPVEN